MIRRGFLKAVAALGAAGFAIPDVSAEEATDALKRDGYRTVLLFRVDPESRLGVVGSATHALLMSGLKGEYEEFHRKAKLYVATRLPGELSADDSLWELRKYEHEDDHPHRVGFPRVNKGLA